MIEIQIRKWNGNTVVSCLGKIRSVDDCLNLSRLIQARFDRNDDPVILNLKRCEVENGSLIGFIVKLNEEAKARGILFGLVIRKASDFHELLQITNLDKILAFRYDNHWFAQDLEERPIVQARQS